ncbi:hypothetical protein B0H13DRAFT_1869540 [Mycena leptocephala]|nr:hypothetical protein B0H13DRAFT_1869540 [Mycena leptocephala]
MTNFPTEPPTACQELVALLAAVDKLAERASSLNRTAHKIQGENSPSFKCPTTHIAPSDRLPDILDKLDTEAAADCVFVRGVTKSPAVVAAEHTDAPDGSRTWWVVYVGREPGLYTTVSEQANSQTKGCPNQQCRKKSSKSEALLFYQQKWGENEVRKWNEVAEGDN